MSIFDEGRNEFEVKKELEQIRNEIKTFEDLVSFLKYVKDNCNCGYGAAPRSISQAALAVAWYFASEFGITGFQAGCTMWDFIRDWQYPKNESGLKIINYDDMLYPQYEHKFEKTISRRTWDELQKMAIERVKTDCGTACYEVSQHWKSIAEGNVPFGYKISD